MRSSISPTRKRPLWFLLREAITSIGVTRLRTMLAVVGIVMGVGSVILMVALGAGSKAAVQESLAKLGSNIISVSNTPPDFRRWRRASGFATFRIRDATEISRLPPILDAAPMTMPQNVKIAAGNQEWDAQLIGTMRNYFSIRDWDIVVGDSFTEDDIRMNRRNAVIGQTVATNACGNINCVGKMIRINKLPFEVVGVLAAKGKSLDGNDMDNIAVVPLGVAKRFSPFTERGDSVPLIMARARSAEALDPAMQQITQYLRVSQRLAPTAKDNFTVFNLASVVSTVTDTSNTLSLLLGAVASISLVVGGIGIMNIMLVTVTERRREIGIRRSIGATQSDILLQFLFEAVLIAIMGGVGGLLLGVGGAVVAHLWIDLPIVINAWSIAAALSIAALVGTASGVYPASRAAKIDPVEALRAL